MVKKYHVMCYLFSFVGIIQIHMKIAFQNISNRVQEVTYERDHT